MHNIAFLFSGQGSQYVGMGKSLFENFSIVRQTFEEANTVLGFDLAKICFSGRLSELNRPFNMQPAILTYSVAAFRLYMQQYGIIPRFCAGHSLGEYSALTCAGSINFADAIEIVYKRGKFVEELLNENVSMSIIDNICKDTVAEVCRKYSGQENYVTVSCFNSPMQTTISGHNEAVREVEDIILDCGGKVTPLIGSAPYHSLLMTSVADRLRDVLKGYNFKPQRYPVISNVSGKPYSDRNSIVDALTTQLVSPVRWQETMQFLKDKKVDLMVELGPNNILCNISRENIPGIETVCFSNNDERQWLANQVTDKENSMKPESIFISKCLAAVAATQNYNDDVTKLKDAIFKPCEYIKSIQKSETLTEKKLEEVLENLYLILNAKKVPQTEQLEIFEQIIDETCMMYCFKDFILNHFI